MANTYIPRSSLDSNKPEQPQAKREKKESVVTSGAQIRQKTVWDKIKDEFVSDDSKSIGDYLLFDVLIPAAKSTLQQLINNGVDMILYGGGGSRRPSNLPATRVSYRNMYDSRPNTSYLNSPQRVRASYNYDDLDFDSRGDAEAVRYRMQEIIDQYQVVTVADYLEISGRDSRNYTDNNYGWTTNVMNADIRRTNYGKYYIDLPQPMALD